MKPFNFVCLLCGLIAPLSAQITITNSVFPAIGDTLHYAFGNQPDAIIQIYTPPGFDQHWDLGNLQPTQYWDQVMRDPVVGMQNAYFPDASVLFNPPNSDDEVYWQVTGDAVNDLGYYGKDPLGMGLDLPFINRPALEEAWAPVNFFDIHQTSGNILTGFPASMAPAYLLNLVPTADSFRIRITQNVLSTIDASGTLTIPGGTFDVLRKKQTTFLSKAVDVKVAPLGWIDISTIGGSLILPLGVDTVVTFHFLNDVSKETIAACTINSAQNEVTGVRYKVVGTPTATTTPGHAVEMEVYPNPVHHTLYGHFQADAGADYALRLFNDRGQLMQEQTIEAPSGQNDFSLPVAGLPRGMYRLVLVRDGTTMDCRSVVAD
jgi:hypothetical protein